MAEGEVEEVRTRVLREQLGPKLVALSGADFSQPLAPSPAPPSRRSDERREGKQQSKPVSHSWRTPDGAQKKPLRRRFHGARRDQCAEHEPRTGAVRAEVMTDRKGRRVTVERRDEVKPREAPPAHGGRGDKAERQHRRSRPRASPDRASGPRPSRPRGN